MSTTNTWTGLGANSTGAQFSAPSCGAYKITGVFAGATVEIQGSQDGETWVDAFADVTNNSQMPVSVPMDLGGYARTTNFAFVQPVVTGGNAQTSINVAATFY